MAPRTSKGKAPAKALSPVARAPSNEFDAVGDEFFEVYNDLLAAKSELVASAPGSERKRFTGELGKNLVCALFFCCFCCSNCFISVPGQDGSCPGSYGEPQCPMDLG